MQAVRGTPTWTCGPPVADRVGVAGGASGGRGDGAGEQDDLGDRDSRSDRKDPGDRGLRRHRRAVRLGAEREVVEGPSADEHQAAWGEDQSSGSNDDRLRRDVPPHWGN